MRDWKAELDVLVAETMALTSNPDDNVARPRPQPQETTESIGLNPIDWRDAEREAIRQRVETFRANQQRFIREREEYAASVLLKAIFDGPR